MMIMETGYNYDLTMQILIIQNQQIILQEDIHQVIFYKIIIEEPSGLMMLVIIIGVFLMVETTFTGIGNMQEEI